jgi:hypothetical protein
VCMMNMLVVVCMMILLIVALMVRIVHYDDNYADCSVHE